MPDVEEPGIHDLLLPMDEWIWQGKKRWSRRSWLKEGEGNWRQISLSVQVEVVLVSLLVLPVINHAIDVAFELQEISVAVDLEVDKDALGKLYRST
jgi:hypothetical protein